MRDPWENKAAVVKHVPDTTEAGLVQYRPGGFSLSPARTLPNFGIAGLSALSRRRSKQCRSNQGEIRDSLFLFDGNEKASASDELLGIPPL